MLFVFAETVEVVDVGVDEEVVVDDGDELTDVVPDGEDDEELGNGVTDVVPIELLLVVDVFEAFEVFEVDTVEFDDAADKFFSEVVLFDLFPLKTPSKNNNPTTAAAASNKPTKIHHFEQLLLVIFPYELSFDVFLIPSVYPFRFF